ncbi:MAG TPA: TonB family protein [Candidatus Saccharimonadales bacterium]|nr:TonB family protein [Candidatus Saccharimonadales bacterium]
MLPTVKDSVAVPTSPESRDGSEISSVAQAGASAQTVALEVRVTVNGARAVDGSEKREPFSETTNTVLVLANGAVIRLSSSVAPGQLLFLTNEKTRKEVICQVVKSKNYQSASGYVELEFTEPVLGFWGMRFPGERHTLQNASLPAARTPETGSLGAEIPHNADVKPAPYADSKPVAAAITPNLADALQEFKTEIKADSRPQSRADLLAPAEPSIDNLKLEANRLQEELSSLLFDEQKQSEAKSSVPVVVTSKQNLGDAAAELLNTATEKPAGTKTATAEAKTERSSLPAPAKNAPPPASSFDDEEVKIPAWLEPLARNAAISAPAAEEGEKDSATETEGSRTSGHSAPIPSHKSAPATARNAATTAAKRTPAAPLFGNSLLHQAVPEPNRPRGGSKAWMAIAAGFVVAVAGGGWYFRDSLGSFAPTHTASGTNTSPTSSGAAVAPSAAPAVNSAALSTPEASVAVTKTNSASVRSETSAPVSSSNQGKVQTAVMTERIPKASSDTDNILKEPPKPEDEVLPEITKPSLGKVRLAKPKIRHSDRVQVNGEMEPTLEGNGDSPSLGENSLGANFAESSKQPAAPAEPVAVGGDVKPARLISSVPPVYPALAKTQHVAGEVRIDALIDANGRVTTMKVVAGPNVLRQAAMDALRQWKYQAATLDGKPAPMHLTVTIQFRLQ